MSSSVDKAKKLKYLGVQFITIDDPVLEQSRLALNGQRNNASCARLSINNSKQNIDALQPYPGLESSNELFTRDEISEINYSLNLGSDSNNKHRFKPTSRLSLLKQVSQTTHEKNDYEKNLDQEENDDLNLFEQSNQQNTGNSNQVNPPSTPLTRCDSLISCQGDDETDFLPGSERRSQLNTPANTQGYINNISNEDRRDNQNLSLTQGEMQNQIWLYAHNAKIPRNLDELDEPNSKKNISSRSLPVKNSPNKKINDNKSNNSNSNSKKNDSTNKANNKNVNNKKINDNSNNDNDNSKKNTNNNKGNESNNNRLLNKNLNNQNQKNIQTRKSASQQINLSYLNENHIQTINGSIVDGRTQLNLNKGEKRLKRIIAMSAPKETITPEFKTKSILKKSYCAQRVHQYFLDSSIPIPTFLKEGSDGNSD